MPPSLAVLPFEGVHLAGAVVGVNRSQVTVDLRTDVASAEITVGNFLGISTGPKTLIGVIINLASAASATGAQQLTCLVDLMGELGGRAGGELRFSRGVSIYPSVGNPARLLGPDQLKTIFTVSRTESITLGHLQQDASIDAVVNVQNLLSKHFAVLGTTGVGKSSGVALILQRIAEAQPDVRTFLIDPHNEYGRCFGERAEVLNPLNLKLPFWLFNFEEIVDVIFKARPGVEEEVRILSEIIPLAKANYTAQGGPADKILRKQDIKGSPYTVDTPVPYRLADIIALIDDRMGKLENRSYSSTYSRLIARIETVRNDRRYAFMFDNANVGGDTMVDVVSHLLRLPPQAKNLTVMQLAGFPTEVVDSVVSVVCRMAFDFGLWSDGEFPLLFVCEEAHRYAPADRGVGFGPTRKALSRIAKEGRKYGVYLGLVSQRAGELDATILSQCSTIFAMRMGNEQDQKIIRSSVSDAAANLLGFIPTLSTREAFAFGEGVALPLRFYFDDLPASQRPSSEASRNHAPSAGKLTGRPLIASIVERWRGATLGQKSSGESTGNLDALAAQEFSSLRMTPAERQSLQAASEPSPEARPSHISKEQIRESFGFRRDLPRR